MSSFILTIVKALALKDGRHTVRIAVTHNGQTRYIPTDVVLNNEKEMKNGRVTGRPDKVSLNMKLQRLVTKYEERANSLQYPDALTCSQLVKMIKKPVTGERHRTLAEIADEYVSQMDGQDREKTCKLYSLAARRYMSFAGKDTLAEHITPISINNYLTYLQKDGLSPTSINIYVTLLKVILNYAAKMKYVKFDIDPFVTAKIPAARKRETYIGVYQLKRIRDMELKAYNLNVVRDIFMLTYYLAGMNLVDMLDYDFRNKEVYYIRRKTRNTKEGDSVVNFTIPDEAMEIIRKYRDRSTGKLVFGRYSSYASCYNVLARKIKVLGQLAGVRHDFTLYSARKSFVQHGFDLGVPLSTLEYCIGQSMKNSRPIFNYVSIMKKHADIAIRVILDNLK